MAKPVNRGLEKIFKSVAKKLPVVLKSQALEAAEVAALFLDQSTRQFLNKNSRGVLARSWKAVLTEDTEGNFGAGAYSNKKYAAIHETGGTIAGKKGALAVPLTKEARRAGSPLNMPGLKYIPGSFYGGGPPRLWNGQVQFVLPKTVKIPSTGYISFAAAKAAPLIEEIIGRGVFDVFAGKTRFGGS